MGRGGTSPCLILLASAERAPLEHWQRSTTLQAGLATRGHIILWRADGLALAEMARRLGVGRRIGRQWLKRVLNQRLAGLSDQPGRGRQPGFPPAVAVPLVQMACARPDTLGRSLAPWDGLERARPLEHDGRVEHRSAATVRRLRAHHQRQPWRAHRWRSPTTPRGPVPAGPTPRRQRALSGCADRPATAAAPPCPAAGHIGTPPAGGARRSARRSPAAVGRVRPPYRAGLRPMRAAPTAAGIPGLLRPSRGGDSHPHHDQPSRLRERTRAYRSTSPHRVDGAWAVCRAVHARAWCMAPPRRAVVLDPPAPAAADRGLCLAGRPAGHAGTVHRPMERGGASLHLDHHVGGEGHG